MPRTAETPGKPALNRVQVLLNDDDMELLDERRGKVPTSAYVRDIIQNHLKNNMVAPDTTATDGHRHKPGVELAQRTVKGVTTTTYRCAHKGCDHTMERTT
jgi:hypothetical protein